MADIRIGADEREIAEIAQRVEAFPTEVDASRRAVGKRVLRTAQRQFVQGVKRAGITRFPQSRIRDLNRRAAGENYAGIWLGLNPIPATFVEGSVTRSGVKLFVSGNLEARGFVAGRSVDIPFRRTDIGSLFGFFTRQDGQVVPLTRPTQSGDPEVIRAPIEDEARPVAQRVGRETARVFTQRFAKDLQGRIVRRSARDG